MRIPAGKSARKKEVVGREEYRGFKILKTGFQ